MDATMLERVQSQLLREASWVKAHAKARSALQLAQSRQSLLASLREIARGQDLSLMVASEKSIIQSDLAHYTNSKGMESSLNAALVELVAIENLLTLVDDRQQYRLIDKAHSLPKNREKGLPLDEARQAFKSHYARLGNLDRARLSDDEKKIIDARKTNILAASKLYAQHQTDTLGLTSHDL
jgi:hypothetical protein